MRRNFASRADKHGGVNRSGDPLKPNTVAGQAVWVDVKGKPLKIGGTTARIIRMLDLQRAFVVQW